MRNDFRVRYRIDGVLYDAKTAEGPRGYRAAIVSRIKIMADAFHRRKAPAPRRTVAVRWAGRIWICACRLFPPVRGERGHTLDPPAVLGFAAFGFRGRRHGTGPTGSGKTTTLYAFLNQINQPDKKIVTIEDPIEYEMKGITQVQVHPAIGLTFAQGLRSMLRHDPDVMMVGEVRDLETAEIAVRVALTGHLVFSTLHTNDAARLPPRGCRTSAWNPI
ncbi:MAG: Flp pilus assembly complex ATPase component TadA [Elusimicrobia bacterium]|nr:Flp pilus assembly complex ATPase component TadA [Elusimicrobiota bacterium]